MLVADDWSVRVISATMLPAARVILRILEAGTPSRTIDAFMLSFMVCCPEGLSDARSPGYTIVTAKETVVVDVVLVLVEVVLVEVEVVEDNVLVEARVVDVVVVAVELVVRVVVGVVCVVFVVDVDGIVVVLRSLGHC